MRTPKSDELRVIDRAKKLLEGGWIKGYYASQTKDGLVDTDPLGPFAVCYCLEGAVYRAQHELHLKPRTPEVRFDFFSERLETALKDSLPAGYLTLPTFNDDPETRKRDVLALLQRARERLKRPEE